ncbi:MAG: hypothetical protein AAF688_15350 [Bacteroidota bacterium]
MADSINSNTKNQTKPISHSIKISGSAMTDVLNNQNSFLENHLKQLDAFKSRLEEVLHKTSNYEK